MDEVRAENERLCAMFMMEGLHDAGYDIAIAAWDNGALELVSQLGEYVPLACTLYWEMYKQSSNYPGVYVYEVCSAFGHWFGTYVIMSGEVPTKEIGNQMLADMALKFYSQGMPGDSVVDLTNLADELLREQYAF